MNRKQAQAAYSALQLARMDAVAEMKKFERKRNASHAFKAAGMQLRQEQLAGLVIAQEDIGTRFHIGGY